MCLQNWVTRYGADPGFIGVHRVYERLTLGTSHAPPPRRGNQNLVFRLATPAQFQLQQQQYHRQQQQQQQQQQVGLGEQYDIGMLCRERYASWLIE